MADQNAEKENQGTEEALAEDNAAGAGKKKKLIYIIIFGVQIIIAFVLVKFFLLPWYSGDERDVTSEEQVVEEQDSGTFGQIYKMPSMTVNPKGSRGRRFAVIEIAFSLPEGPFTEELKKYEPVLTDKYIQYFREKTVMELSADTIMTSLKSDIRKITEEVVGKDKIIDVYFTNFILQ